MDTRSTITVQLSRPPASMAASTSRPAPPPESRMAAMASSSIISLRPSEHITYTSPSMTGMSAVRSVTSTNAPGTPTALYIRLAGTELSPVRSRSEWSVVSRRRLS